MMKNDSPLIDFKIPVLKDGFIRVVDIMGSDDAIVQAARVSYGQGTKKISDDKGLIRYLMRNHHTTPFEMCEIKLHLRVPMDVWRQWIRHRTANVNEYSTRYSLAIDSTHNTNSNEWRIQTSSNKQGSAGFFEKEIGEKLTQREIELHELSKTIYEERIKLGVAREQARKDLPLSTYTEAYWKIDLHNLLHFLELRMNSHAQIEIRTYADIIGTQIVKNWCPITWEAFDDYRLNSISFSNSDLELLKLIISNDIKQFIKLAKSLGYIDKDNQLRNNREFKEFEGKIIRLNLKLPTF